MLTEKRFRLDLSRRIFIVSAVIIFLLTAMAINSFNLPAPDYSSITLVQKFFYQILGYILFLDLLFIDGLIDTIEKENQDCQISLDVQKTLLIKRLTSNWKRISLQLEVRGTGDTRGSQHFFFEKKE